MAELSYPSAGGGSVTDARYEQLVGAALASGVYGTPNAAAPLVYGDGSGLQVKVLADRAALVRGFRWETDGAGLTRSIAANSSGLTRIDLAVLRLNRANWTVTFQVVQGTPAASPSAPVAVQQTGTTGTYELPLAEITVANNATTISAGNVVNRALHIAPPPVTAAGVTTLPTLPNGQLYTDITRGQVYALLNGGQHVIGENGTAASVAGATNWTTVSVVCRRRNGFTYFHARMERAGSSLAAGTDSTMLTLPAEFRPPVTTYLLGYVGGGTLARIEVSTGGVVQIIDYTVTIGVGGSVTIHPVTWPSV